MIEGKIWGRTSPLLKTPLVEVHKIDIVPGGFCSWHHHLHKWNCFVVLDGAITIEIQKKSYELTDCTVLRKGDMTTVKPGEQHRFKANLVPATALEIYYLEPLSDDDIVRSGVGGVDEQLVSPKAPSLAMDLLPTGPTDSFSVPAAIDNLIAHHQV